jgi:hypothetical protein
MSILQTSSLSPLWLLSALLMLGVRTGSQGILTKNWEGQDNVVHLWGLELLTLPVEREKQPESIVGKVKHS